MAIYITKFGETKATYLRKVWPQRKVKKKYFCGENLVAFYTWTESHVLLCDSTEIMDCIAHVRTAQNSRDF